MQAPVARAAAVMLSLSCSLDAMHVPGSNRSLVFKGIKSMLIVQGEEDIKVNL